MEDWDLDWDPRRKDWDCLGKETQEEIGTEIRRHGTGDRLEKGDSGRARETQLAQVQGQK